MSGMSIPTKLWNIEEATIKWNYVGETNGTPVDCKFTREANQILISWTNNILTLVDVETCKFEEALFLGYFRCEFSRVNINKLCIGSIFTVIFKSFKSFKIFP